jgi:secreted Zn-dependent insulinase-like peptidase
MESEYFDFVANNGGSSNASTELHETNFHFNCSNESFEEGIDRIL